jgi:hypothetical protein
LPSPWKAILGPFGIPKIPIQSLNTPANCKEIVMRNILVIAVLAAASWVVALASLKVLGYLIQP